MRRRAGGARRLARRPKALTEAPVLHDVARGAGDVVVGGRGLRRPGRGRGAAAPGTTDERGELVPDPERDGALDPAVRAQALRIAERLLLAAPPPSPGTRRGVGPLASAPYRGGSDDVDLDRTIEVLAERPVPEDVDIVVRERLASRRHVVLAVDVSGSMRGERIRTAAATVGALAGALRGPRGGELAVVAFWSDAALLQRFGSPAEPLGLLDDLLRLPGRGLTNVAFPLQVAARLLTPFPRAQARVLLLTDAVHNAGPDPRPVAGLLPRLDVLLDVSGHHDAELGRELARCGGGALARIDGHRSVAPALGAVLRDR